MNASSSSMPTPGPGTVLGGKFRVIRPIGEGGMGLVLEAENMVTSKRVAIKWMRREVAARAEAVERFLREARASARVRHPNVVDVYDVVQDGGAVFMVMELLEGEPLSAVLERGGMPAHELIALLLEAMRGVAAAHKQGVVHRDIKPDNIFLAQEGDRIARTPKVVDFGISKLTDAEALSLTRTGTTMGTPLYMSFEQLRAARDVDARTDVYAFGVILYEALTGRPPFEAETFTELVIKITTTKPTPPKLLRPDIPRSLDQLIQKAMAKERDERFPSLAAMIAELTRFATEAAFRAQMTADEAPLPRVVSPSDPAPVAAPAPPVMLTERSEANAAATPMNASVSVPSIPGRREAWPWLLGAAALFLVIALLSWFGREPSAPAAAELPVVQPAAATLQPSAASAEPPPLPTGSEPPSTTEVAPAAAPQHLKASASAEQPAVAPQHVKASGAAAPPAVAPPASHATPAAAPRPPVIKSTLSPLKPIEAAPPARPNTPAPKNSEADEKSSRPRAGHPRSSDF